jgi:excisionase family DNA binding protein
MRAETDMAPRAQASDDSWRLLTTQDVAELLGLSRKYVYVMVERGELEHYRLGTRIRFSRNQIERYLSERVTCFD